MLVVLTNARLNVIFRCFNDMLVTPGSVVLPMKRMLPFGCSKLVSVMLFPVLEVTVRIHVVLVCSVVLKNVFTMPWPMMLSAVLFEVMNVLLVKVLLLPPFTVMAGPALLIPVALVNVARSPVTLMPSPVVLLPMILVTRMRELSVPMRNPSSLVLVPMSPVLLLSAATPRLSPMLELLVPLLATSVLLWDPMNIPVPPALLSPLLLTRWLRSLPLPMFMPVPVVLMAMLFEMLFWSELERRIAEPDPTTLKTLPVMLLLSKALIVIPVPVLVVSAVLFAILESSPAPDKRIPSPAPERTMELFVIVLLCPALNDMPAVAVADMLLFCIEWFLPPLISTPVPVALIQLPE